MPCTSGRKMKIAIWLYTTAVVLGSVAWGLVGWAFRHIFNDTLGGRPLPPVTRWMMENTTAPAWLALSLALVVFRWTWKRQPRPEQVATYAGAALLWLTFLVAFAAVALSMPFVSIVVRMGK